MDLRTRARGDDRSSATPTTSRAASRSSGCSTSAASSSAFAGEVTGLISAGAFVAFEQPAQAPARRVRGHAARAAAACAGPQPRASASGRQPRSRRRSSAPGARRGRGGEREWWELNEQGTILRGERTGARCVSAIRSRCAWRASTRSAGASTSSRPYVRERRRGARRAEPSNYASSGDGEGQGQAQDRRRRRRVQPLRLAPLRADRAARVRDRARGHRGQGAAHLRRAAQGRLRGDPRRRAVAALRPHPALRPGVARKPRPRARRASCCCTGASSTASPRARRSAG